MRCEKTIQDNLYLVRTILDEINDGTVTAPVNVDQSKTFDRVDYLFLDVALAVASFGKGFRTWTELLYQSSSTVVRVNGKRSKSFNITRFIRQDCP